MRMQIDQTKLLKNLKYEIKGEDSFEPLSDCLDAIMWGFQIALSLLFLGIYLIDKLLL